MIVLDTDVISELMKAVPSEVVVAWLDRQPRVDLCLTSITQAEVLQGIAFLPKGKRRENLAATAQALFEEDFASRVLPFDNEAAKAYAVIAGDRRRGGRPLPVLDGQIAAIARANAAHLATRDGNDFVHCGVEVVNPWVGP